MYAKVLFSKPKNRNIVNISGYKHSLVMVICLSLILNNEAVIDNIPNIKETSVFLSIFDFLGKKYKYQNNQLILYSTETVKNSVIPNELSELIHGTIYLLPVLLFLNGQVDFFKTGGCKIGRYKTNGRPFEHIYSVMQEFGATRQGYSLFLNKCYLSTVIDIMKYSTEQDKLAGPLVSGATKTAILCAVQAKGITTILNPYLKADVLEMIEYIKVCGGKCKLKRNKLMVEPPILIDATKYRLTSDVSEIVTFVAIAQYHNVDISLRNINNLQIVKQALKKEFYLFKKMGIQIKLDKKNSTIDVSPVKKIKAIGDIKVNGETIYSDSQPFFVLLLLDQHIETSIIEEVWDNRFQYAKELKRIGEPIEVLNNKEIIITNKTNVINENSVLSSSDLRGAACLLIYASKHIGHIIKNVEHMERGYDNFWGKMETMGIKYVVK